VYLRPQFSLLQRPLEAARRAPGSGGHRTAQDALIQADELTQKLLCMRDPERRDFSAQLEEAMTVSVAPLDQLLFRQRGHAHLYLDVDDGADAVIPGQGGPFDLPLQFLHTEGRAPSP